VVFAKRVGLVKVLVGGLLLAGFLMIIPLVKKPQRGPIDHAFELIESQSSSERQTAIGIFSSYPELKDRWLPYVKRCLNDEDSEVRRKALKLIATIKDKEIVHRIVKMLKDESDVIKEEAIEALKNFACGFDTQKVLSIARSEQDPDLRIKMLGLALACGNKQAIDEMIKVIKEEGEIFMEDAVLYFKKYIEFNFAEFDEFEKWWQEKRREVVWDKQRKRFTVKSP
jgi:hypothetical protein